MCEFTVILDGETVFRDVVYAKSAEGTVTVKSILGETKQFKDAQIVEVNVHSTRLVLQSIRK